MRFRILDFNRLLDIPGRPGSQLTCHMPAFFSPVPGSYLTGISHLSDPGRVGVTCSYPSYPHMEAIWRFFSASIANCFFLRTEMLCTSGRAFRDKTFFVAILRFWLPWLFIHPLKGGVPSYSSLSHSPIGLSLSITYIFFADLFVWCVLCCCCAFCFLERTIEVQ